ncbi:MAG: redox-sensing transcriptional repressor Rex [Sedimentisphaeraceae bacterium JB056]
MAKEIGKSVPQPTIRRLPSYLQVLRNCQKKGRTNISSSYIAQQLQLEAIQVRKDLSATGITGQAGVGFSVTALISHIEDFLGWDNTRDAFLIGCGNLGSALIGYEGFKARGLNIIAGFDVDKDKVGKTISGKLIFELEKLPDLVNRMHIKLGVLTVPPEVSQAVAEYAVKAGIKAIWNFTSVKLDLPEDIVVERVGLESSLAVLSSKLKEKLDNEKE